MGDDEEAPKFFGSTTVGSRGQVVIPSDLREKLDIEQGDKLLFFNFPHRDKKFSVMKPEALRDIEEFVRRMKEKAEVGEVQEELDG